MFTSFLNHDLVFSKTLSAPQKQNTIIIIFYLFWVLDRIPVWGRGRGGGGEVSIMPTNDAGTPEGRSRRMQLVLTLPTCKESGGFRGWRAHSATSDTSSKPTLASRASDHVAVDWGFPQPPPQTSDTSCWSRLLTGRLAVWQKFSPSPPWVHLSC